MATLTTDLALALDPAQLVRAAGLMPDAWQERAIRSLAPRMLLNCSRQSGKSTVSAALAVWTALYAPGSLILLLSPSLRQSQELFRKCLDFYRAADQPEPPEAESALRLELANGSRIISLPGKEASIRGYSRVRLLIVDEASRCADELYLSVRPMLAVSGGRLMLLSTPFGRRGFFYEAWEHGGEGWERFRVTATDCPRISAEFLVEERLTLGEWWFTQEYLCEFREAVDAVFSHEAIEAAFASDGTVSTAPAFPRFGG